MNLQLTQGELEIYRELKYLRSLRRVARGITHDYNNIFAGILGKLEPKNGGVDDSNRTLTDLVNRAIGKTETLFAFARYGQQKPQLLSVSGFTENAAKALAALSPACTVDYRSDGAMVKVHGSFGALVLMLFYVGENSVEAMSSGGLLQVEVALDAKVEQSFYLTITISDNGPGVDPELVDTMFTPLVTTKRSTGHHGLGLALAREIAEAHGGSLLYQSSPPGKGAFVFRLPAVTKDKQIKSQAAANTTPSPRKKVRQVFFVVDDDSTLLDYLVQGLQRKGHIVFSASTCAEASEEFCQISNIVTVLLVDVGLTDIDGVECVAGLTGSRRSPAIIFMSGEQDEGRSAAIPRAAFIMKPFTIGQLEDLAANVTA